MASTFSNLGLELQATGENANTWGDKTNTNLSMIDERLSEIHTISSTSTSQTISAPSDGTSGENTRFATLKYTGSASSAITVTLPSSVKIVYNVINGTGQSITFQCSTTTTTATVKSGQSGIIHSDGSANVYLISSLANDFEEDVTIKTGDGALLTLQTSDTSVVDGDVLGALQFQAPNESGGTDAITVSAAIEAVSQTTFAADANATKLVFKTGASGVATAKAQINNTGTFSILTDGQEINFGADGDVKLTHVHNVGLLLNSTRRLYFEDDTNLDQYIGSGGSGVLQIASPTEIDITATTIDMNGNLALGDNNKIISGDGSDFQIYHDGSNSYIQNATGEIIIKTTSDSAVTLQHNSASKIFTQSTGATVSGVLTTTGNISCSGAITASGDITAFSDKRLKSDIETIDNALDKVMNMRGVSFTKQAEKKIGVIAQEVEKVLPEVVSDGEYKSVAYGNMVGVLIEAIKELKSQLDNHKQGCKCHDATK